MNGAFGAQILSRVEDAGINASAPPQQRWVDGWLLRFSPGKAKRARCINPVSDGRLPIEERLALCRRVYEAAGLPMIVRMTPFSRPAGLEEVLESNGMRRIDDTRVMVLADLTAIEPPALPAGTFIRPLALQPFAHCVGRLRGSPLSQRQAHGERLMNSPVPFHAFEMVCDGQVQACGQFALEDTLVGLYDVFTASPARGRGVASLLCRQLLHQARQLGATLAYLQVEADNSPARAVYHRLGFADGYAYHYRADPGEPG